jgi:hypothetical protein
MVNLMIQDTLLSLFLKSIRNFNNYIFKFIPTRT